MKDELIKKIERSLRSIFFALIEFNVYAEITAMKYFIRKMQHSVVSPVSPRFDQSSFLKTGWNRWAYTSE